MSDSKQPQAKPTSETDEKRKTDPDRKRAPDPPAGQSIEGDGSPGLSISGGGGHA